MRVMQQQRARVQVADCVHGRGVEVADEVVIENDIVSEAHESCDENCFVAMLFTRCFPRDVSVVTKEPSTYFPRCIHVHTGHLGTIEDLSIARA